MKKMGLFRCMLPKFFVPKQKKIHQSEKLVKTIGVDEKIQFVDEKFNF
jgi:hypothetical protein